MYNDIRGDSVTPFKAEYKANSAIAAGNDILFIVALITITIMSSAISSPWNTIVFDNNFMSISSLLIIRYETYPVNANASDISMKMFFITWLTVVLSSSF